MLTLTLLVSLLFVPAESAGKSSSEWSAHPFFAALQCMVEFWVRATRAISATATPDHGKQSTHHGQENQNVKQLMSQSRKVKARQLETTRTGARVSDRLDPPRWWATASRVCPRDRPNGRGTQTAARVGTEVPQNQCRGDDDSAHVADRPGVVEPHEPQQLRPRQLQG